MYNASWLHDLFVRGQSGLSGRRPSPLACPFFLSPKYFQAPAMQAIENNAYANFWWQITCIMGDVQVAYGFCFRTVQFEARAAMHHATNTQARHEPLHSL